MNDYPVLVLKDVDRPDPLDPQAANVEHRDEIRALMRETRYLVGLLTHAPAGELAATLTTALHRAIEIDRRADRLDRSAETLAQAHRRAGTYGGRYADDLGVRDG